MKVIFIILSVLLFWECSNKINYPKNYKSTLIGKIVVYYMGHEVGEPPFTKDYLEDLKNANCVRLYTNINFDNKTPYKEISTDSSGIYKIRTDENNIAIALVDCPKGLHIIDSLKNMNYAKYHIINFEKELRDTVFIVDTLYQMLPN